MQWPTNCSLLALSVTDKHGETVTQFTYLGCTNSGKGSKPEVLSRNSPNNYSNTGKTQTNVDNQKHPPQILRLDLSEYYSHVSIPICLLDVDAYSTPSKASKCHGDEVR